jgi:hypothetical protein
LDNIFSIENHNCATCDNYDRCDIKEIVEIFKGREDLFLSKTKEIQKQIKSYIQHPAFMLNMQLDLLGSLTVLGMLGYAKAKKEDSVVQAEKISTQGGKTN